MSELENDKGNKDIADVKTSIASLADEVKNTNASLAQLADTLIAANKPKEVVIDEPDAADLTPTQLEERIITRVTKAANDKIENIQTRQTALNATLVELHQSYPEIGTTGSDMNKKMVEFHAKLPKHLQETAEGYRMATLQAAQDTGTVPVSKRSKNPDSEDFSLSPEGNPQPRRSQKPVKLSQDTINFAELMGVNHKDDKVKARLTEYAGRTYAKYR